ncbi:MAG: dipeptidase [Bryobacteraceae bacterium]|jgi:acetylornithine deacetylase/succinyl-diaminopimelate desuccinylase-like protein
MDAVLKVLADNHGSYLRDLAEFVAIPSVSTDPAHESDVQRAADWVAQRLRKAGPIEVERWETPHYPAVFGRWNGAPGAPTVLVYGHMDVQPPDPIELWHSPPFILTARNGRLYGRGVSDDKASMLLPILAAEAFFLAGEKPPVNLRFIFETEEEIGSVNLPLLVRERRDALACDVVLSADGGMWRPEIPSITVSSRGLAGLSFTVRGPGKDLHSGRHGGGVANPLHAAAQLVASLHDGGKVAVAGFYDDVEAIHPALRKALDRLSFDEKKYLADVGASAGFGEPGYGMLERQWYRPTIEVNGFYGGYQGPGGKTVLPSEAHVKLTCRLVSNQRPDDVIGKLRHHLEQHCPPGINLAIEETHHGAMAYCVSPDSPAVRAAADTLARIFGMPPDFVGMGGTIPITTTFREVLGADTIFFSFSTADEDIHAPNEFYRPERFRMGLEAWVLIWRNLAKQLHGR